MFLGLLFFPSPSFSDLLWWFFAASLCLLPVLTPDCPPGQGGWCPYGTFQTSCGIGGEPRLARTGWLTCGPGPAGGPGPPSSVASSWQCQPWRRDGWVRVKRGTVDVEYDIWFSTYTLWSLVTNALWELTSLKIITALRDKCEGATTSKEASTYSTKKSQFSLLSS